MIEPHIKKYLRLISYASTSVMVFFAASYIIKNVKDKTMEYKTAIPPLVSEAVADVGDGDGDCGTP